MDDWYKQLSDAIDSTLFRWDQYTMVQKKNTEENNQLFQP